MLFRSVTIGAGTTVAALLYMSVDVLLGRAVPDAARARGGEGR